MGNQSGRPIVAAAAVKVETARGHPPGKRQGFQGWRLRADGPIPSDAATLIIAQRTAGKTTLNLNLVDAC